ncbi:MAG: hypothetical protein U0996_25010 [Planctomycetaceae bacterium]
MALGLHIFQPLVKFREMLSESTSLRTLFGVANANDALAKIGYGYAEDDEYQFEDVAKQPKSVPRALVALEDFNSSKGTTSSWGTTVELTLLIEAKTLDADQAKSLSERYASFLSRIEGVCDDVRNLAASGTRLNITNIRTVIAPQRADMKDTDNNEERWWTVLLVEAGG